MLYTEIVLHVDLIIIKKLTNKRRVHQYYICVSVIKYLPCLSCPLDLLLQNNNTDSIMMIIITTITRRRLIPASIPIAMMV